MGDAESYDNSVKSLATKFVENFKKYQDGVTKDVLSAGPQL